jgi:uncharacterized membrane protein
VAAADLPRQVSPASFNRAFGWAGLLLGFALGGFFDGILLHQILQWHHLLSALEGEPFTDLRFQVLADGVFHALMYLVALVGLWLLWRVRRELAAPGAGRLLIANALIGFGLWHIVDGIISHWLLGIHRIRMDSPNPLLWDLIWFTAFGVLFVVAGWWLRRRPGDGTPAARRPVAASLLAAAVFLAGPVAALPPPGDSPTLVLFKPGITPERGGGGRRAGAVVRCRRRAVGHRAGAGGRCAHPLPPRRPRRHQLYLRGWLPSLDRARRVNSEGAKP